MAPRVRQDQDLRIRLNHQIPHPHRLRAQFAMATSAVRRATVLHPVLRPIHRDLPATQASLRKSLAIQFSCAMER